MLEKRDQSFDCLKGILITLVVYGHISYVGTLDVVLRVISDAIYLFHMPIFFILSGVFFKPVLDRNRLRNFFYRLVFPYLVFYSCYLIILWLAGCYGSIEMSNSFDGEWMSALFVSPIASFWYLHSLIFFGVLMSFLIHFVSKVSRPEYWRSTFYFFAVLLITWGLANLGFRLYLWASFYLLVGFLCSKYILGFERSWGATSVGFCLVCLLPFYMPSQTNVEVFRSWQFLFVASLMVSFLGARKWFTSSFLAFVGRNSLLVLLFHVYFLNVMKPAKSLFLALDASGVLYVAVATALGVYGSIWVGYVLDKTRVFSILFKSKAVQ